MIKTLQKVGTEGNYLNIIKARYDKPTVNIIMNCEKLKHFLLDQEQDKNVHCYCQLMSDREGKTMHWRKDSLCNKLYWKAVC